MTFQPCTISRFQAANTTPARARFEIHQSPWVSLAEHPIPLKCPLGRHGVLAPAWHLHLSLPQAAGNAGTASPVQPHEAGGCLLSLHGGRDGKCTGSSYWPCYPAIYCPGSGFEHIWKLAWFKMSKLQWKNRYGFHDQRDPSFSKQTAPSAASAAFSPFPKLIKNTYIYWQSCGTWVTPRFVLISLGPETSLGSHCLWNQNFHHLLFLFFLNCEGTGPLVNMDSLPESAADPCI